MIVLDTHVWIWWVSAVDGLSENQSSAIRKGEQDGIGVSAISCWEVAKLVQLTSDLMHPRHFSELVSDEAQESIRRTAIHIEVDLGLEESRNLADAFFDYSTLSPKDQKQPALGIVQRDGRRAMTILRGAPTEITPASWAEVLAQVDRHE